jgi:hypothetical protein
MYKITTHFNISLLFCACVHPAEWCCTLTFWNCRQNKAMDGLKDDVEELNSRVKGANQRARRLLGK